MFSLLRSKFLFNLENLIVHHVIWINGQTQIAHRLFHDVMKKIGRTHFMIFENRHLMWWIVAKGPEPVHIYSTGCIETGITWKCPILYRLLLLNAQDILGLFLRIWCFSFSGRLTTNLNVFVFLDEDRLIFLRALAHDIFQLLHIWAKCLHDCTIVLLFFRRDNIKWLDVYGLYNSFIWVLNVILDHLIFA